MRVVAFIFVTIATFSLFSFICSPIADWYEFKKYYPKKYQNQYKKYSTTGKRAYVLIITVLLFVLLCVLLYQTSREHFVAFIGGILGCIISAILTIVNVLTPKWPMGLITYEKDKEEYLELEEKISQTNDYFLKEEYESQQDEILNKYTNN